MDCYRSRRVFFSITKQRQPSSLQSKDNLHLCLWPGTSHLSSGNSASGKPLVESTVYRLKLRSTMERIMAQLRQQDKEPQ
uniref:Uncharacterized protein n=1 Tax=Zea mays TaxID=4577 RepID=C4J021_MAIZE|nr:unknown [Zea mays]